MNTMMDAIVKRSADAPPSLERVPVPKPGYGEVLIRIRKTAISRTDMHILGWDEWAKQRVRLPLTLGHEYVGVIEEIGAGVEGLMPGQRVSGDGHIPCGHCRNCRGGNAQWCKYTKNVGADINGAFAQFLCIPAKNVVPINESLSEDVVAFFNAYGNATHTALEFDVVGEDVLVTSANPIGIMAALICKKNGARQVIITDESEYRLALAKKMGLFTVNTAMEDAADVMRELGMVEGFDVALEVGGDGKNLPQLLKSMRNGGKIALLGIFGEEAAIDWNQIISKGITVQGIYGRKMYETWYKMSAMMQSGLNLAPIITHKFHYTEFEKAFKIAAGGECGKILLTWED